MSYETLAIERRGAVATLWMDRPAVFNAFNEQLIAELDNIRAVDPSIEKFNLVAHSQGGLTSRYVMNVRPDLVASVTTMGSPHQGAPIADVVNNVFPEGSLLGGAFELVTDAAGSLIDKLSGDGVSKGDTRALTYEFTTQGAASFNATYPAGLPTSDCGEGPSSVTINGNDINLYSWFNPVTNSNTKHTLYRCFYKYYWY